MKLNHLPTATPTGGRAACPHFNIAVTHPSFKEAPESQSKGMGHHCRKTYATGQEKIPRGNPPGKRELGLQEGQQAQKAEVLRIRDGQRLGQAPCEERVLAKPVPMVPTPQELGFYPQARGSR